jgi:hypothetical protein
MVTAPAKSNEREPPGARLSFTSSGASSVTVSATGTLRKKIHCQPRPDVIGPPISHPAVPAIAPIEAQTPSALLRSAPSWNVVVMIASAVGVITAAVMPCTTRAAISTGPLQASPQASEASEQRGAGHEHALPSKQVGKAAAKQQQAAEAQQVRAQHPLQVVRGEPQIGADRGQRDEHDRRVEDHHEERGAQEGEGLPAPRIRLR